LSDNTRRWSGDHCVDPAVVPGVLFCNRRLTDVPAAIVDLAPTILDLFGVPIPAYMDGKVLSLASGDDGTSKFDIQKSKPAAVAGATR
jgi:arylsulfatase A-like enzyme